MFCEKCGAQLDENQPFCPNCGNRIGAPAAPQPAPNPGYAPNAGYAPRPARAPRAPRPATGGPLDKLNAMAPLEKIYFLCTAGLLLVCFILSQLKTFGNSWGSAVIAAGSPFFGNVIQWLFVLMITFLVLDYFDKFNFALFPIFLVAAAAVILLIYVIIWIDIDVGMTVGGWFFFILQIFLTAATVLLLLERLKNRR